MIPLHRDIRLFWRRSMRCANPLIAPGATTLEGRGRTARCGVSGRSPVPHPGGTISRGAAFKAGPFPPPLGTAGSAGAAPLPSSPASVEKLCIGR